MRMSAPHLRKNQALDLMYRAHLNVCYWQQTVKVHSLWKVKASCAIGLLGVLGTVLGLYLEKSMASVCSAVIAVIIIALNQLIQSADCKEAKRLVELWSRLEHDADRLWADGQASEWTSRNLRDRLIALYEDLKNNNSREHLPQNDRRVRMCHSIVNARLAAITGVPGFNGGNYVGSSETAPANTRTDATVTTAQTGST